MVDGMLRVADGSDVEEKEKEKTEIELNIWFYRVTFVVRTFSDEIEIRVIACAFPILTLTPRSDLA